MKFQITKMISTVFLHTSHIVSLLFETPLIIRVIDLKQVHVLLFFVFCAKTNEGSQKLKRLNDQRKRDMCHDSVIVF